MAADSFSVRDVVAGFRFLHGGAAGLVELVALHPEYRRGRSHRGRNKAGGLWPRTWYGRGEEDVLAFVRKYAAERLVCFGLNPRPQVAVNERGYLRGSREEEIASVRNAVFDFDLKGDAVTDRRLSSFRRFLDSSLSYFLDQGFRRPAMAFTGQGFHLLFAFSSVRVAGCPDIGGRLRVFRDAYRGSFAQELSRQEAVLDSTEDLRRCVKVYGTAKPDVGIVSRFYAPGVRVEDEALRDYLLSLVVPEPGGNCGAVGRRAGIALAVGEELPSWFGPLLSADARLRDYWHGNGKANGLDTSRTGYDFSLAQRLLALGHTDVAELATILTLRPDGAAQEKGEIYVKRTIANALLR